MVDGSGIVTIGTSSSTAITIGRSGITATFPGTVTITGSTTTLQNLVVSGNCVGCGIGNFTAGGDLSGSSTSQTVIGIQGRAISSTAPSTNQVLTWNGTFWTPANVSSTGGSGITAINGLSNATTSIIGAGTVTVSTSSPNVITITGTGSGAITINSLTTSTFSIQGTANQITVATSSPNILSLSLPQNIGTTSIPTFGGLFLNGNATTTGNLVVLGSLLDAGGNSYVTSTKNILPTINPTLPPYSMVGDHSTNNITAFNTLLSNLQAGSGGVVQFPPGYFIVSGCPATSPDTNGIQKTIVFEGAGNAGNGPGFSPGYDSYGFGGTTLEFRCANTSGGVFSTTGYGSIEFEDMNIVDTALTDTVPLIYSTKTNLKIHDVYMFGNKSQSCIQLGSGVTGDSQGYQGYGGYIERNVLIGCTPGISALNYVNALWISDNYILGNYETGGPFYNGAAIVINGGTNGAAGNMLWNNVIETQQFEWGIQLVKDSYTQGFNSCWDSSGSTVSCYRTETGAIQDSLKCGYNDAPACIIAASNSTINANYPAQVARVDLTGNTTALSPTTLYTIPNGQAGIYRTTVAGRITSPGTGTQWDVRGWASGVVQCASPQDPLTSTAYTTSCTFTGYLAAGESISYDSIYTGVTSNPTYRLDAVVERVN